MKSVWHGETPSGLSNSIRLSNIYYVSPRCCENKNENKTSAPALKELSFSWEDSVYRRALPQSGSLGLK